MAGDQVMVVAVVSGDSVTARSIRGLSAAKAVERAAKRSAEESCDGALTPRSTAIFAPCPRSMRIVCAVARGQGSTIIPDGTYVDAGAPPRKASADGWRDRLAASHTTSHGVRLVLAKKGVSDPTGLTYDEALPGALSYGWIDGHRTRRDDATYRVRFTPRQARGSGHGEMSR